MSRAHRDGGPATETVAPGRRERVPQTLLLQVLSGPDRGLEQLLEAGTHVIGKDPASSLVLGDPGVSRQHLAVELRAEAILLRDLGSRNGSYYQGARFVEVSVGVGATIELGRSSVRITLPRAAGAMLPSERESFGELVGRSLPMRELYATLERLADSEVSVLLSGETGTGKDLCAQAIARSGPRAGRPFVVCDLAAISRSLIESELFGHVRGAFTGAERDRAGAFAEADGGTLFVDEIGELELAMQPRLLRALEQGAVKPVGKDTHRKVDVRVIAATHRDLREEVKAGRFRQDLFHRLAVVEVRVPPLRERKEDIAVLVAHFLAGADVEVPAETLALLVDHDWPGNVRELRNVIERARSLMGKEKKLSAFLLGLEARPARPEPLADFHEAKERLLSAWERDYALRLLRRTGGNIAKAARIAGLDRGSLHRLLRRHGLDRHAQGPDDR